jgi:hypothetical protein
MLKADLTFSEVSSPPDNMCKSGHVAGVGERFFKASGPNLPRERWGVYCNTCIMIARKLADKREAEGRGPKPTRNQDEAAEIAKILQFDPDRS